MQTYDSTSKKLHWLIAAIIISLLIAGFIMGDLPKSPSRHLIYNLHKSFGTTVLLLMIIRIIWRLTHTPPKLPNTMPKWQVTGAHVTHGLLYLIGIIMPASGLLMSISHGHPPNIFGLFVINLPIPQTQQLADIFSTSHYLLGWLLSILIILHIGAAFSHGLNKNSIIWRMWSKKNAK